MARGDYERLTPEAIDQMWPRMRAGHAAEADCSCAGAVDRRRCVPIWIGVAGSDPSRGGGQRGG